MSVLSFPRSMGSSVVRQGGPAVGIDLGTTHSVVSIIEEGMLQPRSLVYGGQVLVPSQIYFDPKTQEERVGLDTLEDAQNDPDQLIRSSKRFLGMSQKEPLISNGRRYTPEGVAEVLLRYLAQHPELKRLAKETGVLQAVVTVPAHFDDAARQATLAAARAAGFQVLRIVHEPTAAALAYSMIQDGVGQEPTEASENLRSLNPQGFPGAVVSPGDVSEPHIPYGPRGLSAVESAQGSSLKETFLVYDFGGGTFDVSVVSRQKLLFQVLASEGDVCLGGDDIDEAFALHIMELLKTQSHVGFVESSHLLRFLSALAEQAKRSLSHNGTVRLNDLYAGNRQHPWNLDFEVTRDMLESCALPLLQRTLVLTERALHAARRRPQDISRILLVGGSTRLPLVRRLLEEHFSGCAVDARLQPDLAVSWGAALQAAIILGTAPDMILVDVCSHTLGIGVAESPEVVADNFKKMARKYGVVQGIRDDVLADFLGERFEDFQRDLHGVLRVAPIINRNSQLPACKSEFFHTIYANQPAVHVIVVQGEGGTVAENRLIGSFLFELQQPVEEGARCEIQLTYDANGMVHVLARQLGTDNAARAQFDSRSGTVQGWLPLAAAVQTPAAGVIGGQPATVSNALLVKGKRTLMTLLPTDQRRERLEELLALYAQELDRALDQDNEDQLVKLEDQIQHLLGHIQPSGEKHV